MRLLIILALCLGSLVAAELSYTRVTLPGDGGNGGGAITGWWDSDCHVLYQPESKGNKYTWIKAPQSVEVIAAPAESQRPAKRTFRRLPDLPYGRVKVGDRTYLGWYHQASGTVYPSDPKTVMPFGQAENHMEEVMAAPSAMPARARDDLDHWAIAHIEDIEAEEAKRKAEAAKP